MQINPQPANQSLWKFICEYFNTCWTTFLKLRKWFHLTKVA